MTVTRDGRSGVGRVIRDWTTTEADFALTASAVDEQLAGSSAGETTDRDVIFDSKTGATVNHHAQISAGAPCTFTSRDPSIATVNGSGFVTRVGNGTARIIATGPRCAKEVSCAISQQTGQTVNVFNRFTPGSLARHCADAVDSRLAGKNPATHQAIYTTQDHAAGTYVRNPNCWAADVDLTPLSPWNNYGGNKKAGTLVSPRHLVLAAHYWPAVGMQFRFIKADGSIVTRTMTAFLNVANTDITVGVLDSDVSAGIGFAKILPTAALAATPHISTVYTSTPAYGIPGIGLDQEEKALVFEWVADFSSPPQQAAAVRQPTAGTTRADFTETIIVGDSGNPFCLIIDGALVLLFTWLGVTGGSCFRYHAAAVNAAMTTLGGGYQLTTADLSAFPTY